MTLFFSPSVMTITADDVRRALIEIGEKYPGATDNFLRPQTHNRRRPLDLLQQYSEAELLNQVRHCADWLHTTGALATQRKTFNMRATAYGIKHWVSDWVRTEKCEARGMEGSDYVCMMAFIVACWIAGAQEHPGHGNPFYKFSSRLYWPQRTNHKISAV